MMLRALVGSLLLCCTIAQDTPPGKYVLDLDGPAENHFDQIVNVYKQELQALITFFLNSSHIPPQILPLVNKVGEDLDKYVKQPFADEMRGIAKASGVGIGEILYMNFIYDLTAFCTSTVAQDSKGRIFHARNLDYGFPDYLRNLTIEIDFMSGGKLAYRGTTYAGYVGLLTGMRPGAFTVTVDERDQGKWWENALEILNKEKTGLSFLIRDVLATPGANFSQALQRYSDTPLIAPVYIILGGMLPGEGAIITRNQTHAVDVWLLFKGDMPNNFWRLETNYDHWEPVPPSDDRRTPGNNAMQAMGNSNITKDALYTVMSTPKVYKAETTYTAVMSAQDPDMYQTWVRHLK